MSNSVVFTRGGKSRFTVKSGMPGHKAAAEAARLNEIAVDHRDFKEGDSFVAMPSALVANLPFVGCTGTLAADLIFGR
jgi:hypothetical protein